MLMRSSTNTHRIPTRLVLSVAFLACLAWLSLRLFREPALDAGNPPAGAAGEAREMRVEPHAQRANQEGAAAREYLEQTSEGQSLMLAVTAERFGLKWQAKAPFGVDTGGGYLGLSHDQNLNAWFHDDGITIRPTLSKRQKEKAWRLDLKFKAYGYGKQLTAAPPIVARNVKGDRIEYERVHPSVLRSGIGNRQSALTEWYKNRAEGIEQGFTLNERPERSEAVSDNEPLRLVVGLTGSLRARADDEGQAAELLNERGEGVASYSKLVAVDANGRKLAARMETDEAGDEIALVVEDAAAKYPIVVDPITATLEQRLDGGFFRQAEARFGFSVAIDGNMAAVGAWREDTNPQGFLVPDAGAVYLFSRSGSTWSPVTSPVRPDATANNECGWGLAISGARVVYGCPGANSGAGRAFLYDPVTGLKEVVPPYPSGPIANDRFATSVAISGNIIVVGEPGGDTIFTTDNGSRSIFKINPDSTVSHVLSSQVISPSNNGASGTYVAIDGDTVVVGVPGSELVAVERLNSSGFPFGGVEVLRASDGAAGDQFGNSVAISGNTVVIGAWGDDDKGTNAGAAYVFVRGSDGSWSQQQKLTASDGRTNDFFSNHAVAIEGNTVVVGAYAQDPATSPVNLNDNRGAAYIFMRSGTVWTEQYRLFASFFGRAGDEYGISVDLSGNTVIVGARTAPANDGTARTGAASVYRLDCVAPYAANVIVPLLNNQPVPSLSICPGRTDLHLRASYSGTTSSTSFQWRKNGVNIPGKTDINFNFNVVNNGPGMVSASDAGSYDVIITNACGSEISSPITVTIHSFSLNPTSQNFSASGSNGIVNITSSGSCSYTATSNASWITINSGTPGTAPGTVGFTVAANPGSQRIGTLTIAGQTFTVNQEAAPGSQGVVQFSSSSYSLQEDCTMVTVTVNRAGDTSGAASVDYNTSDVTASERRDYITALGKLQFAPGQTSKTFVVLINEDSYVESDETFNVNLTNPFGVTLGGPSIATVRITDDAVEPATNPIDEARNYVCQHYHDFLNRQPDQSGWNFWTNEITSCGANQSCIEAKRMNVSAAFFLSLEFQNTGYLVERLYKAAHGDATGASTLGGAHQLPVPIVRFREFLFDTQRIGLDVIVGQPGWEQQLESNKQAFVAEFVQRSRFTTALPTSLTPTQFVDALNANAGNPVSASERQTAINLFDGAGDTANVASRAQALRVVAEDADLKSAEFNRAFVLMQFFGYLRRNPNDPQDVDHTGYDFWLMKLNQFNGNFINAEMVKAFIVSDEYRQRFGSN